MAFDGITIANIVHELKATLTGARIAKIAQPESDELLLTLKTTGGQTRLLLSADASLPLLYLTDDNKPSPATAPSFCMLLRKHLQNGRITAVTQPGLERIVHLQIEHLDELGDLRHKKLVIELMGKHSNIIFINDEDIIIDSIKHISGLVSSVREVLPGRPYYLPESLVRQNPLTVTAEEFLPLVTAKAMPLYQALYQSFSGLSPVIAQEFCFRAGLDGDTSTDLLKVCPEKGAALFQVFFHCMEQIARADFTPTLYTELPASPHNTAGIEKPVEYSAIPLQMYRDKNAVPCASISALLVRFYAAKNQSTRIRQKSVDLRKIVQTALERNRKKYDLQLRQLQDTEKKDRYRIYGELLNTYGYNVSPHVKSLEAVNYYTGETVVIPLDSTLTPGENAKRYFDKYGKLKRTAEALSTLTVSVAEEIKHLESIAAALDMALLEEDLVQIKQELTAAGYIRRKGGQKKEKVTSKPLHYLSSDGFHMYVGKNNYQNDELTFKFAVGNDWWFHAKGYPGSHVIVKTEGAVLPDRTFVEAAGLAAYYSKGQGQEKVEIDYTEKKNVKKPGGGKPGFVVYYTNFSMLAEPDISSLVQVK